MGVGTSGSRPPNTSNEQGYNYGLNSRVQGDLQIQPRQYGKQPFYQKSKILSSSEQPYMIGHGQAGERVSFIPTSSYSSLTREMIGLKEKPVSTKVAGGPKGDFAYEVDQHYTTKQQTNYTLKNLSKIFDKQSLATFTQAPSGPIYNIKQYNATYQGGFERGVPTGKGVAHFQDGGYYTGDFLQGDANGQGVYIYPNGSVYEGQFKGSQFNGKGSLIYADKRMKYEGQFANGLPQGHGVQTYDEGDRYQGQFNRGVKQGFGTYSWANGLKYQGNWQNGLMHGNGALLQGSNVVYQGQFVKGMKSGHGVFRTQKGSYEGKFDNDYLNGPGSFLWNDGRLYVGNFYKTMMDDEEGNAKLYYPNGQVATGVWQKNHNKLLSNIKNDPSVSGILNQYRNEHEKGLTYKPVNQLNDLKQSGNVRASGVRESDMRMRQGFQSEISSEQGVVINRTSNISSNQVSPISYEQPKAYNYV